MKRLPASILLLIAFSLAHAKAIEEDVGGVITFNSTTPTNADIAGWTTGWGGSGVTGWDYVGAVNGASGVYLGNNWVLTAGHVGAGTFSLSGTAYSIIAGSARGIFNEDGSAADLTLFRLTLAPNLPSLALAFSDPTEFSQFQSGSSVAMIGYGGGQGETWGLNTVTTVNLGVRVNGYSYISDDFRTAFGTITYGSGNDAASITNNSRLIVGDSGGGDFIYNSSLGSWELAGINEAVDDSNNSYMVQISAYSSQIESITSVPEPSTFALLALSLLGLIGKTRFVPKRGRLPSHSE